MKQPYEMTKEEYIHFVNSNEYDDWLINMDEKDLEEIDSICFNYAFEKAKPFLIKAKETQSKKIFKKYHKQAMEIIDSRHKPDNDYDSLQIWAKQKGLI